MVVEKRQQAAVGREKLPQEDTTKERNRAASRGRGGSELHEGRGGAVAAGAAKHSAACRWKGGERGSRQRLWRRYPVGLDRAHIPKSVALRMPRDIPPTQRDRKWWAKPEQPFCREEKRAGPLWFWETMFRRAWLFLMLPKAWKDNCYLR